MLNTIPLYLNPKTRLLTAIKEKRRLVGWALSVFVLWGIGLGPQLMKIFFFIFKPRGIQDNELGSILNVMAIFLYFILSGGGPLILIMVYVYGDALVKSFNTFVAIEAIMKKSMSIVLY